MTDFSTITACGECCTGCPKKLDGRCPGCIESDGCVPEWAESGRCKVHACAREHQAQFCGLCAEFACEKLPEMIPWNPGIIERMITLRDEYKNNKFCSGCDNCSGGRIESIYQPYDGLKEIRDINEDYNAPFVRG